jgi:hypothetical protein
MTSVSGAEQLAPRGPFSLRAAAEFGSDPTKAGRLRTRTSRGSRFPPTRDSPGPVRHRAVAGGHVGVLSPSPCEAAAWSVLSARRPARQGTGVRTALGAALGETFRLAGDRGTTV